MEAAKAAASGAEARVRSMESELLSLKTEAEGIRAELAAKAERLELLEGGQLSPVSV